MASVRAQGQPNFERGSRGTDRTDPICRAVERGVVIVLNVERDDVGERVVGVGEGFRLGVRVGILGDRRGSAGDADDGEDGLKNRFQGCASNLLIRDSQRSLNEQVMVSSS